MVEAWASIPIGVLGGALYVATSHVVLTKLKVDDAIDAFAVHGAGGFWSLISAGLFSCKRVRVRVRVRFMRLLEPNLGRPLLL